MLNPEHPHPGDERIDVATKNPIGKIVGTAVGALTDPLGTAGKVVEQAKGTAALGRMVAEQVGRSAVAKVAEAAGLTGGAESPAESRSANLRAVPEVNEPAHTVGRGPVAVRQEEPAKKQGDAVARNLNATGQEADDKTPTMQRTASGSGMSPAKKAPAKRSPAKKAPAKKAAAGGPVKKATTGGPVKKAATGAPVQKVAGAEPAKKTPAAKKTPGKKVAAPSPGTGEVPTPADVAKAVKKSPAKKATKKSPPKTARQVANIEGEDVGTPAGTPGASKGFNPDTADTDLQQPGTEPLMDPATVKAAKSAMDTAQKAADPDKG